MRKEIWSFIQDVGIQVSVILTVVIVLVWQLVIILRHHGG